MKKRPCLYLVIIFLFFSALIFNACSKGGGTATPPNPCAGITITVSGTPADADAGVSNGSITATASGSTGFTFSLNNGTAQASGTFSNLAAGSYTITAKNTNGCSGSSIIIVSKKNACAGTPGPDFIAVKAITATNCAVTGCHNGTQAPDYTVDCNIVDYGTLIKQRAVDQAGTATQMPQPPRAALLQADRDKITAWITAGGHITD
jgi:hypothetical protein